MKQPSSSLLVPILLLACLVGILIPVTEAGEKPAPRLKLQIINGSAQTIDIFWLPPPRDPVMAKGVEFTNLRVFEADTHAYHDRSLTTGNENPQIKAAVERAQAGGKYERVQRAMSKLLEKIWGPTNQP